MLQGDLRQGALGSVQLLKHWCLVPIQAPRLSGNLKGGANVASGLMVCTYIWAGQAWWDQTVVCLVSQPPALLSHFFLSSSEPVVCHSKCLLLICSLIASLLVRAKPAQGSVTLRDFNPPTLHRSQTQAGRWGCWISHHS